jgi:hypothetical protein
MLRHFAGLSVPDDPWVQLGSAELRRKVRRSIQETRPGKMSVYSAAVSCISPGQLLVTNSSQ